MKSKLFAFSGACHSGKTTAIDTLKKWLENQGHACDVLKELLRKQDGINDIDKIRANSSRYLALQSKIIREKIRQETEMDSPWPVLVDRSVADSLYYLTTYTNKHKLSAAELEEYADLIRLIHDHAASKPYAAVFVFRPITVTQVDPLRPVNLTRLQRAEFSCIRTLNRGLFDGLDDVYFRTVAASSSEDMDAMFSAILRISKCH